MDKVPDRLKYLSISDNIMSFCVVDTLVQFRLTQPDFQPPEADGHCIELKENTSKFESTLCDVTSIAGRASAIVIACVTLR